MPQFQNLIREWSARLQLRDLSNEANYFFTGTLWTFRIKRNLCASSMSFGKLLFFYLQMPLQLLQLCQNIQEISVGEYKEQCVSG